VLGCRRLLVRRWGDHRFWARNVGCLKRWRQEWYLVEQDVVAGCAILLSGGQQLAESVV
jgi:hypothetical protein